ncbi:DUF6049 family protein [Nocardia harenae]|uniref:DUF6049 family protein n=1 Tax=Nocardia harenae TaxID=358707 RepID=UPI00082B6453|nr:DUF6049 family protein [Nocardia harenae]
MTRGLFRVAAAILTILGSILVVAPLTGQAAAQPNVAGDADQQIGAPKFLKLSLDSVTPTAVTTASDPVVTVTGTVTNIGDRVVDDISVRIQRAPAITEPGGVRSSLRLDQVNYEVVGPFQDVAERLSPGQRRQFILTVAIRGATDGSEGALEITEPGVYPLLLNVNGEPAYGTQARLDDARFLLPVLGVPPAGGSEPAVPAAPAPPVATTVLWPLADRPRWVPTEPAEDPGQVLLTDDELAASLGKGGRLDQLLGALENEIGVDGARNRTLADGICLAIDPDLLLTAAAMTDGYRVLASPSDPDGQTRAGSGAAQAQAWLDRLRVVAAANCTVALPFAQADLTALAAVHDPALTARAVREPADIVDRILGARSLRGVGIPDSGSIDPSAGGLLTEQNIRTAVLAESAVAEQGTAGASGADDLTQGPSGAEPTPAEPARPEVVRMPDIVPAGPVAALAETPAGEGPGARPDPALHAVTYDIWSATALAAVGSNPPTPSFTPARVRYDVTNDSRTARLQDALGALTWTALNPRPDRPRGQLLVPPQQWGANREEAITLLRQVDALLTSGMATARTLPDLLAQPADPRPYEPDHLPRAVADGVPESFVAPIRDQGARITALSRALVEVPELELTPTEYVTPLRDDLIRALTLSDRRAGGTAQPDVYAQRRLDRTGSTMDRIYGSVTVLPPGGVYTLASEQSPLLLVARNELPVAIRVKFRIEAPPEAAIDDTGEQILPPNGTRSFQIPTEVNDSRNLVIPISLTTPDGVALGNATSVSVRSNAYGQALAIITACAATLLLLLAGRRLWHRFRGRPDPADETFDPEVERQVSRYRRFLARAVRRREPL